MIEGGEDQDVPGQQGQEVPPDTEETTNLDLPDDLQLDEEGNDNTEGESSQFSISKLKVV